MKTHLPSDPLPKPEPPSEGCCCRGGCFPCVWDYYRWALEDWENQVSKADPPD